jgi:transcriptional regulator with GAF, ATPase, and Fis domain
VEYVKDELRPAESATVLTRWFGAVPVSVRVVVRPDASTAVIDDAACLALEAFERSYVENLLRKHNGNVTRSAREAKKDRRAFGRLIKRYQIDRGMV